METVAFLAEPIERLDPDPEMLPDRAFVKGIGGAGQLELAVERLVADAQQGAVGNPKAVALRRDGRRFHVDRDRPALVEAQRGERVAKLPIAVVGGHDGAGAKALLDAVLVLPGDRQRSLEHRGLDLGDRRNRDFGRKHVVEDVVVAQIGMGEDIVANRLARAQPATVADHQPRLGPKHRDMVADRLGVGRADPDVDQSDAVAAVAHQVIGGHLEPPPAARRDLGLGIGEIVVTVEPAGDRQPGEARARFAQCGDGETNELVDVADVVGEQDVALAMLGRGPGVVTQAGEAEVGARCVEQRQRARRAEIPGAVGDLVADMDQLGRGKPAAKFGARQAVEGQVGAVDHIGIRDFAGRGADRDLDRIIADEMLKLFGEIGAEQRRARDRTGVNPGVVEPGEGARRRGRGNFGIISDAKLGISEGAAVARGVVGSVALAGEGSERGAEPLDRRRIARFQLVQNEGNVGGGGRHAHAASDAVGSLKRQALLI